MRTIRTKVYQFSELSESAKENAMEKLSDINFGFDWWESVYEDAAEIGLKINGFDIDRASYCKGDFTLNAYEVANKIKENHGEVCETYKTALEFITEWDALVKEHKEDIEDGDTYDFDNAADDLEEEFLKSICEHYRIMLSKEYDYLASKEAIIETIEANEYEFKADGTRF